jgi:hypothetical protein
MNAFASAAAEILGAFFGGLWYRVTGLNIALIISFSIGTAGGICIMFYGAIYPHYMPIMCIVARTGVAAAFNIVYYGN